VTSYKDNSFQQRWTGQWAAEAQAAYALDRNMRRVPFVPHGLDRAPFSAEALMSAPPTVRYAPDFKEERDRRLHYVEVKGCGRGEIIRLKAEQLSALWVVADELPVEFCFWNNQQRLLVDITIEDTHKVAGQAERDGNVGVFDPDTAPKPYYELAWIMLAANGREHALGR
jgi:hypothetical protein